MKASARTLLFLMLNVLAVEAVGATRTVLLSGRAAPGIASGIFAPLGENDAYGIAINDAGQVAFSAMLQTGPGAVNATNNAGIWLDRGTAGTQLITRKGSRPSGIPVGSKLSSIGLAGLSEQGDIVFGAGIQSGNLTPVQGILLYQDSSVRGVAYEGQRAPGTPNGIYFDRFEDLQFGGSGRLSFSSQLRNEAGDVFFDGDYGIWSRAPGSPLSLVARTYDPLPGLPAAELRFLDSYTTDVSSSGRVAFIAYYFENGRSLTAILSTNATGGLDLVAGGGTTTPGAPPGTGFGFFHRPQFAGGDRVVAVSLLSSDQPIINNWNDSCIWRFGLAGEPSQLIVREGDSAIGFPQAGYFGDLQQIQLHTNDAGDVVFNAYIFDQPSREGREIGRGIWMSRYGATPEFIDVSRMEVFGVRATDATTLYGVAGMNDRRQLVFAGQVSRVGDLPTDGGALFVQDRGGSLRLVVRNGDEIDVDSGPGVDRRRVKEFTLPEDFFNDAGQIVFSATFADGSAGAFVSDVGTTLLGDYNNNGTVGLEDYTAWKTAFGTTNLAADGNGDGVVDAADYAVWRDNLGRSVMSGGAGSLALPEPDTAQITCAMFGAIWALVRGRRAVT